MSYSIKTTNGIIISSSLGGMCQSDLSVSLYKARRFIIYENKLVTPSPGS